MRGSLALAVIAFPNELAEPVQPRVEEKAESGLGVPVVDLINIEQIPAHTWYASRCEVTYDGRQPPAFATELADLLIESLRLDFAFVRLCDPEMRQTVEASCGDAWRTFPEWLQQRLAVSGQISREEVLNQISGPDEACSGIVIPIGINGERGFVAAACYRSDFPDQIDEQLLSVTANSAATAFRNAHLINELRNAQKVLCDRERELRTARDELEIKVAEGTSELRRSEFYLAEGQRLAHAGSWSFKPDLTCDYWSRELYEILGFDAKIGIPTISDYFTRVHPEDRAVVEATIRGMIAAGEGCDLKKRIIRPDGVQRVIRCVGMAVREKGVVTRFVGTAMDITEQEELTQELRRREAFLEEAQRLSHTGSFDWNVITGERTWSKENYRILGYEPLVKPTFERVRDRVHPDDLQLWLKAFAQASEGEQVDFEHRLLMPEVR
ncbi:MAG: sensor signal transduction histidine kinase [Verrucomicrobiales bacterium]|nr:sensor signal transduction histidine kinase [Verrucomicrobiales bacterium]